MNELGLIVIGGVVRATVVAALGVAIVAALRRRGPAAGSLAALAALLVLLVAPALAAGPWPRWWTLDPSRAEAPPSAPARPADGVGSPQTAAGGEKPPAATPARVAGESSWGEVFLRELQRELRQPSAGPGARWRWPSWVALAYLGGLAVGLGRLLLGLRAVRALRRGGRAIVDPELLDEVDLLRAEMCCTRPVEVLESDEVSTPATIGWRRPAILLPIHWRDWDDRERRVVLAHELAHISRGDYLPGIVAQLSLAVHFYHPLAHWLGGQLRLQQELAADAWGAGLAGGARAYLTTLAAMALRQADRPIRGPARAFLPTRGTFLRRIEMLRDSRQIHHAPISGVSRTLTIAALAAAGLIVAGIRGPDAPAIARAQEAPRPAAGAVDLSYVPGETAMLVAIRPAGFFGRPGFEPLAEILNRPLDLGGGKLGVPPLEIEQFLAFWLRNPPHGPGDPRPGGEPLIGKVAGIILRTTKPRAWGVTAAGLIAGEPEEVPYEGKAYVRAKGGAASWSYFTPDERTIIVAEEPTLKELIKAGPAPRAAHRWDEAWKAVDPGQIAIAFDSGWVRGRMEMLAGQGKPLPAQFAAFAPLWEKSRSFALGLEATRGLKLEAQANCGPADDARRVAETFDAALTLGRNLTQSLRQQSGGGLAGQSKRALLELLDPILAKARMRVLEAGGASAVRLESSADVKVAELVNVFLPAVQAARIAAKRAQSINNLKQIALAMHNYHSANDHFPPAVGLGPDGKTPHSWRVAILPYVDQKDAYDRYRFDEPWDGPNNRKLLAEMPAVYRSPGDDARSTNASYFVLTGPDTLFSGNKGTPLTEIPDGTSSTILAVEAKRDIPWTKPEDIPFDRQGRLPELGGYQPEAFIAAFADGSVRVIKDSINLQVLKALITPKGGEQIGQP